MGAQAQREVTFHATHTSNTHIIFFATGDI